jgi:hypothetical protein
MKILSAAVASALLAVGPVIAFAPRSAVNHPTRQSLQLFATPPLELADYLAKAHEAKLKAVQEAEAKKNAEIEVRPYQR